MANRNIGSARYTLLPMIACVVHDGSNGFAWLVATCTPGEDLLYHDRSITYRITAADYLTAIDLLTSSYRWCTSSSLCSPDYLDCLEWGSIDVAYRFAVDKRNSLAFLLSTLTLSLFINCYCETKAFASASKSRIVSISLGKGCGA